MTPHRGHAFCGERFCVPHWLHEEFGRNLGGRGFDLLVWYPELDTQATTEQGVIEEAVPWLKAQFRARVRRVGSQSQAARGYWKQADCPHEPKCSIEPHCWLKTQKEGH